MYSECLLSYDDLRDVFLFTTVTHLSKRLVLSSKGNVMKAGASYIVFFAYSHVQIQIGSEIRCSDHARLFLDGLHAS